MNGTLALVRHGQSLWNARNIWTGLTDIGLSPLGKKEAIAAATLLRDIPFSQAFTSELSRAQQTLTLILEALGAVSIPIIHTPALNERDYGAYTGKNKLEVEKILGESEYIKLRRSWDYPVPGGESLKDVYARVIPYYTGEILPLLQQGKIILISAHGNSLRALVKFIEKIPDAKIAELEIRTGQIIVYTISQNGTVVTREERYSPAVFSDKKT